MNNNNIFYHDKPTFGLDIGYGSLKVMQIVQTGPASKNKKQVVGYGYARFDPECIKGGVIVNPEALAKVVVNLIENNMVGRLNSRRVVVTIPVARTYNRAMTLPKLSKKDLMSAIHLEAEQYIPMSLDDLYIDYDVSSTTDKETQVLAVATPKKIVDSYMTLVNILGLEPIAIETTIDASSRLVSQAEQSEVPMVLLDLGSLSSDITIYDKALIVTGTVPGGGDNFSIAIKNKLGVTSQEAHTIKTKYGLGVSKKQKELQEALEPNLLQLLKEVKRMVRYYEERAGDGSKIGQVITMGGGANMPGLTDYLTNLLRLPVRMCDPWQNISFGKLPMPDIAEKSMYITVAGLALLQQEEIFS